MPHVAVDQEIAADPATVFEWFTETQLLTRWWPSEAELDVRPGGEFRMYWDGPGVTLRGKYRVVEPGERLDHTWSWDHDDLPPRLVSITFESSSVGTHVSVKHEYELEVEQGDYRDGWEFFLGRLADQIRHG